MNMEFVEIMEIVGRALVDLAALGAQKREDEKQEKLESTQGKKNR